MYAVPVSVNDGTCPHVEVCNTFLEHFQCKDFYWFSMLMIYMHTYLYFAPIYLYEFMLDYSLSEFIFQKMVEWWYITERMISRVKFTFIRKIED
jgi:hypothetical protein